MLPSPLGLQHGALASPGKYIRAAYWAQPASHFLTSLAKHRLKKRERTSASEILIQQVGSLPLLSRAAPLTFLTCERPEHSLAPT